MRYKHDHKSDTRKRILDASSRLFLRSGIDGVGIAAIMKEAKLTNGAFYAHFQSKDELVTETLIFALKRKEDELFGSVSNLKDFLRSYLSQDHRSQMSLGCPVAALLTDVTRHNSSTRHVITEWSKRMILRIKSYLEGEDVARENVATTVLACLLGALQLSRAVDDPEFSDRILNNACETAIGMVNGSPCACKAIP